MQPTSVLAAEANGSYYKTSERKFEKIEEKLITL
jgi:hypothetical protein